MGPSSLPLDGARLFTISVVVGLCLGVLTQLGQSFLPEGIGQIANSISPWVSVAFVVGALAAGWRVAAIAGFLTLGVALIGYYGMVWIRFGYTGGSTSLILWAIRALAGGAVFGPAGWFWRWTRGVARVAAIALLSAVFVTEGLYLLV